MKPVLLFVVGLAIGAGVMFALKPDHAVEVREAQQSEKVAQAQAMALHGQLEKARADLARAEQDAESTRGALSATSTAAPVAVKPNAPAEEGEKKRKAANMIKEIGKAQMRSQLDGKLATLKDRLHLTADQEAKLKDLFGGAGDQMTKALDRFLEGEAQPGDFAKIARLQRGDLPASVEAMLTDDQKPAYAAFQVEEKANRIEMKANAELLGLQAAGGLSPEQKDQAFTQLSQLASSEEEMDFDALKDGDAVLGFMDEAIGKRVTAMKPILSDGQMEIYQRQVEMQRQMMSQFMSPATKAR